VGVLISIITFLFLELVLSVKKFHLFHPQEIDSKLISVVILCTPVILIIFYWHKKEGSSFLKCKYISQVSKSENLSFDWKHAMLLQDDG